MTEWWERCFLLAQTVQTPVHRLSQEKKLSHHSVMSNIKKSIKYHTCLTLITFFLILIFLDFSALERPDTGCSFLLQKSHKAHWHEQTKSQKYSNNMISVASWYKLTEWKNRGRLRALKSDVSEEHRLKLSVGWAVERKRGQAAKTNDINRVRPFAGAPFG